MAARHPDARQADADGARSGASAYLRDPEAIYRRSFEIIRREVELGHLPPDIAAVAVRLIHACGMTDIARDLAFSEDVAERGRAAIRAGALVLCDSGMVAAGIMRRHLPGNAVVCTLDDPAARALARSLGTTRSAAAVELWGERIAGAVIAIGNAPTALFHLLEMVRGTGATPAAVLGFPVGFVGAAESKEALIASGLPHLALRGRRGGSALAAAAVNALILPEAQTP